MEIAFECTGEIIACAVGDLGLSATEFKLNLVEHAEAHRAAERNIVAERSCTVIIGCYGIEMIGIVGSLRIEYHRALVKTRTGACVAEFATGGEIILEAVHQHRADLEAVCVGVYALHDQKLIVVLIALGVVDTDAGDPLPFGNE